MARSDLNAVDALHEAARKVYTIISCVAAGPRVAEHAGLLFDPFVRAAHAIVNVDAKSQCVPAIGLPATVLLEGLAGEASLPTHDSKSSTLSEAFDAVGYTLRTRLPACEQEREPP